MNAPTSAAHASSAPSPVLSINPLVLSAPGRAVELQVRVSAPVTGSGLPILLLAHGLGRSNHLSSLNGYAPVAQYFASRGFVVIQPTHLDSRTLSHVSRNPNAPAPWHQRALDMTLVLDQLDTLERAVPTLAGRMDRTRVAVLGHSMGGHTASMLLGARPLLGAPDLKLAEPRIQAGVLLAAPGRSEAFSELAATNYAFLALDFSTMKTPALVIAGDKDDSPHLTVAGASWHADPYLLSSGPKSLLTVFEGEHGLGGVSGYDVAETTDENPERVANVLRLAWAYLRTQLYPGDSAWQEAQRALTEDTKPFGRIESK